MSEHERPTPENLSAAAPDLYAALVMMLGDKEPLCSAPGVACPYCAEVFAARSALAKARGES